MKILILSISLLFLVNSAFSQAIIVDSSFGNNGRIEYKDLDSVFTPYFFLNIDNGKNLLINRRNKFLYVDSLGGKLNKAGISNPFEFIPESKLFSTSKVDILSNNELYINYIGFTTTFRSFIRNIHLDNFQDSTFGNKGLLLLSGKDDIAINYGHNTNDQLFILQQQSNNDGNPISLKLKKLENDVFDDSISIKLNGCQNNPYLLNSSNVLSTKKGKVFIGYTKVCDDSTNTYLLRMNSDLSIDKMFGENGYLNLTEKLALGRNHGIDYILEGKDNEVFVFLDMNATGNSTLVVKVQEDGNIDLNFGMNGKLLLDDYQLWNTQNAPYYDQVEDEIQMFLYNRVEGKSKLIGISRNGQLLPRYDINNGLVFANLIHQFTPFNEQSYFAIYPSQDTLSNSFELIKFKKNNLLSVRNQDKILSNIQYKVFNDRLEIENVDHWIEYVQLCNLLGQELFNQKIESSESIITLKIGDQRSSLNVVKVSDRFGRTHSFKIFH